jgi:hypothetical protein
MRPFLCTGGFNVGKTDLLRTQKNELMSMIKAEGLEPFNFEWSLVASAFDYTIEVAQLKYDNTEYYFTFDFNEGYDYCFCSPGSNSIYSQSNSLNWQNQRVIFSKWLSNLHREIDEPDLWAEVNKYRIDDFDNVIIGNDQFTVPQVDVLTLGINNIREYIQTYALANDQQMFYVNEKLDYLIDGAKRQGKRDWFNICMGALMSLAMTLSLDQNQAKTFWEIMKSAISGVIHFLPEVM